MEKLFKILGELLFLYGFIESHLCRKIKSLSCCYSANVKVSLWGLKFLVNKHGSIFPSLWGECRWGRCLFLFVDWIDSEIIEADGDVTLLLIEARVFCLFGCKNTFFSWMSFFYLFFSRPLKLFLTRRFSLIPILLIRFQPYCLFWVVVYGN